MSVTMLSENDLTAMITVLERRLEAGPLVNVGDGRRCVQYCVIVALSCLIEWLHSGMSQGSIQARVYALEREERLVKLLTDTIQHEKTLLALAARRTQNASLPISRLPDELLSITLSILNEDEGGTNIAAVLRVCHRWRRVAIQQSSLWNHVSVLNSRASIDRAQIYLSRSASSRLDLSIHGSPGVPLPLDILLDQELATRILEPHASRLASFSVLAYSRHRDQLFPLRSPTPHLRKLSITWQGGHQLPHPFLPTHAPQVHLTHLHLSYDHNAYIADAFDLVPVELLQSLHIDGSHDISVPTLLQRASALTSLSWAASASRSTWLSLPQSITLPRLKDLSVRGGLPLALLFSILIAPQLQSLSIYLPDYRSQGANVAPGLLSGGTSRFPNLTSVTFRTITNITPEQFTSFLSLYPALEVLKLGEMANDRHSLDILAPLEQARRPTRTLRHLVLLFTSSANTFDRPTWAHPVMSTSTSPPSLSRFGYVLGRILGRGTEQLRMSLFVPGAKKEDFGTAIASHSMVDFTPEGRLSGESPF